MSRKYTPRHQSKRWLDGDCPREVLAIYDDKREVDRYTIFYATVEGGPGHQTLVYASLSESGMGYHGELTVFQAQEFRYRNAHRARKWTSLPESVRDWISKELGRADQ
jgi:hypothetical protein